MKPQFGNFRKSSCQHTVLHQTSPQSKVFIFLFSYTFIPSYTFIRFFKKKRPNAYIENSFLNRLQMQVRLSKNAQCAGMRIYENRQIEVSLFQITLWVIRRSYQALVSFLKWFLCLIWLIEKGWSGYKILVLTKFT